MAFARWPALGLALLGLALGGCRARMVKVHGKLLDKGKPLVVSANTYVTLSFIPVDAQESERTSRNAKFDPKAGAYSVELPPGKYRTMVVIANPGAGPDGKLNAPRPRTSSKEHDLTRNQQLDLEVPAP